MKSHKLSVLSLAITVAIGFGAWPSSSLARSYGPACTVSELVERDSDNDGILNRRDFDDDNDRIPDRLDRDDDNDCENTNCQHGS